LESLRAGEALRYPVNFERLADLLQRESRILDFGCGYGRVSGLLFEQGYHKHRQDSYRGKRAEAADALLVVEVSDTTLGYDEEIKLPRYAASGVPEVWIENLPDNELRVYRNPAGNTYATSLTLRSGDMVSVLAFPETIFKVQDILG
jgi:SAM-dependent methyltransferase